jgi:hypothetical protein
MPLPKNLINRYFQDSIHEYQCPACSLRWYIPATLGESDYYEWLAASFSWYYSADTWDKQQALICLREYGCRSFVETGSGAGHLLRLTSKYGINGFGIEINEQAVESCRASGLTVYYPSEISGAGQAPEALVSLQTLEHMQDPVGYLSDLVRQFSVSTLIIAVPCHESLIGYTSDPFIWPPHHFTCWSRKAFAALADAIGYSLVKTIYEPLEYAEFRNRIFAEPRQRLRGLSWFPARVVRRPVFELLKRFNVPWASREHSMLVVLRRNGLRGRERV